MSYFVTNSKIVEDRFLRHSVHRLGESRQSNTLSLRNKATHGARVLHNAPFLRGIIEGRAGKYSVGKAKKGLNLLKCFLVNEPREYRKIIINKKYRILTNKIGFADHCLEYGTIFQLAGKKNKRAKKKCKLSLKSINSSFQCFHQ